MSVTFACPAPIGRHDRVVLGHGGGGRLSAELVESVFVPAFRNDVLAALEDQATLTLEPGVRVAVTTDAFVVEPIFFPGGDIGRLAVCGTVNNLVVGGAIARFITAAFVIEEGMLVADLERIARSMRAACDEAGVSLVAGDTKVVERGKGDQVFITTTGLGTYPGMRRPLSVAAARPGDRVLVTGTLGDHGIAIHAARLGLAFETVLQSDVAPIGKLAAAILDACPDARCMRDPTRGGFATTLNEIAAASRVGIVVTERDLPVQPEVANACEMLGLDPAYLANAGTIVAVVPAADAERVLAAVRALPRGRDAALVGEVVDTRAGTVAVRSNNGGERALPMLAGEPLSRVC